ncbi:MAG: hypothetical protein K2N67_02410, partial [Mucispirillum sp.]|nr:hypothetical protein [Mucispirillum sp.]
MKIILCLLCSLFPFMLYADFSDKNVKCDYYIEDKDEFAEVLLGGEYSNKDATGTLCSEDETGITGISIKNGKLTGDIIIIDYYNKKNKSIKSEAYMNGFDNISAFLVFLATISGEDMDDMDDIVDIDEILPQLKKGKAIFKEY